MTPPERLLRLHRHGLINVLVLGGTAEARLQVAFAFHRHSRVRRGPFVCVDGDREEPRLRSALQACVSGADLEPWDALRAAQHGTFFLDAVGSLSEDTQRLLLAFTGRQGALQEGEERGWAGRLAVGNAEHLSIAVSRGRFLPTLYDSLDKVRVELPSPMAIAGG